MLNGLRHKAFLFLLVVCGVALVFSVRMRDRVVLKIAITDSPSSRSLRNLLESADRPIGPGLPKRVEVQVFQLDYDHLYRAVVSRSDESKFDVVMVDDPWLPELVYKHLLDPVQVGEINRSIDIERFAAEFLRVCYYRKSDKIEHGVSPPRRPRLAQLVRENSTLDPSKLQIVKRTYDLYALPYVGNVQVLARHKPTGDRADSAFDQLLKPPGQFTWDGVERALETDKGSFFSRRATNNSAVADFLPILWSNGGCLVRWENGQEMSGLNTDQARRAFEQDLRLGSKGPVQYTRFKDRDVFQLLAAPKSVAISWLAYRAGSNDENLQWYVMPQSSSPAPEEKDLASTCIDSQEKAAFHSKPPGTSLLGAWLLTVPRAASNRKVAWSFVSWVLAKSDKLEESAVSPASSCDMSSFSLGQASPEYAHGQPTAFEDRMSCGVKNAVRNSTPRPAHPKWHEIEAALGFRIRQAHWRTIKTEDVAKLASEEVQRILRESESGDRQ
jgi:Bacterial extracellular solute-binding protein